MLNKDCTPEGDDEELPPLPPLEDDGEGDGDGVDVDEEEREPDNESRDETDIVRVERNAGSFLFLSNLKEKEAFDGKCGSE